MRILLLITLISICQSLFSQNPIDKKPIPDFHFRDTTINDHKFIFKELSESAYLSIGYVHRNELVVEPVSSLVTKKDSLLIIKLQNGKSDTLKSFRQPSGYHESYEITGLWKKRNQIVASFANWEENVDLLIDLQDGYTYMLGPIYEFSKDFNFVFSFANASEQPIYTGGFSIAEFINEKLQTIFNASLYHSTITEVRWLTEHNCLITEGTFGPDTKITHRRYFELQIINKR